MAPTADPGKVLVDADGGSLVLLVLLVRVVALVLLGKVAGWREDHFLCGQSRKI